MKKTIEISLGYKVNENKTYFSFEEIDFAKKELLLNQAKYTYAKNFGDIIELTAHNIICPYCGCIIPAYNHSFFPLKYKFIEKERDAIDQFLLPPQTNLFSKESDTSTLQLNTVYREDTDIKCHHCSELLVNSQYVSPYTITFITEKETETTSLECEFFTVEGNYISEWLKIIDDFVLPLKEKVLFDLKSGKVILSISDSNKDIITQELDTVNCHKSFIFSLIAKSIKLRRELKNCFELITESSFPFDDSMAYLPAYILTTRFIGYPHDFYYHIPMENLGYEKAAADMHYARNIPRLYTHSRLPNKKSIKRLFFENMWLFFYIEEIKKLWDFFTREYTAPDIFAKRITEITDVLIFLHKYPGTFEFFQDYSKINGYSNALGFLQDNNGKLYAKSYCMMADDFKNFEKIKWKDKAQSVADYGFENDPSYYNGPILDCFIDRFWFTRIKTRQEFIQAGMELHNCLINYTPKCKNDVYKIVDSSSNTVVAAVEVDKKNMLIQAKLAHNKDISDNRKIDIALNKWMRINNIKFSDIRRPRPLYDFL